MQQELVSCSNFIKMPTQWCIILIGLNQGPLEFWTMTTAILLSDWARERSNCNGSVFQDVEIASFHMPPLALENDFQGPKNSLKMT